MKCRVFARKRSKAGAAFVVREGLDGDAARIHELKAQLFRETDLLLQAHDDFEETVENEETFLRRCHQSPTSVFLVAEASDGELLGHLAILGGPYRRTRHVGQLGMAVARSWWGEGVGGALLDEAIDWAIQNRHLTRITLQVYASNERARALYRGRGFVEEGVLRREVRKDDGSFEDLVMMARFL
jgi:RimJ/RimL family protein N-acetyltransferase